MSRRVAVANSEPCHAASVNLGGSVVGWRFFSFVLSSASCGPFPDPFFLKSPTCKPVGLLLCVPACAGVRHRGFAPPAPTKAAQGGLQAKENKMNRVPTIEELMRKPGSELQAIFQNATNAATSKNISADEREAARLTLARLAACRKAPCRPQR